ncbi:S-adenosyl-L-methionine-dependent methyltransferase [Schizophyllum amplum]|uniref:Protein arginine methyltransferase NDUFAF7 n=1 Tax=Schizophyllum amplum TaxID=97359 RepID=A0A550CIB0_9AGAR|nr:S-adenosyl-L-methionine-dependent methyltransferase [Auriculariopsis ampla]
MSLCLGHPVHGYYTSSANPVFGKAGDFITSPEISQVFGELLGIWYLTQFSAHPKPALRLIELGPGRGTLMEDILRVFRHLLAKLPVPPEISIHLVETSEPLRKLQKSKLSAFKHDVHWYDSIDDVAQQDDGRTYTMVLAHEFFDALPIDIYQKMDGGNFLERLVASSEDASGREHLRAVSSTMTPKAALLNTAVQTYTSPKASGFADPLDALARRLAALPSGATAEICWPAWDVAASISRLLRGGGCGLVIDYGGERMFGDSFRAFKSHKIVSPYETPGQCDLTANVDFKFLRHAFESVDHRPDQSTEADPIRTHMLLTQAAFLKGMGVDIRLQRLIQAAQKEGGERGKETAERLRQGVERLVGTGVAAADKGDGVLERGSGMGKEYKVLGVTCGASEDVWPFI